MTRLPRRIGERAAGHVIVHFRFHIIILYYYILSSLIFCSTISDLSSSPPSIFTAAILSSQASCQTKEKEERIRLVLFFPSPAPSRHRHFPSPAAAGEGKCLVRISRRENRCRQILTRSAPKWSSMNRMEEVNTRKSSRSASLSSHSTAFLSYDSLSYLILQHSLSSDSLSSLIL